MRAVGCDSACWCVSASAVGRLRMLEIGLGGQSEHAVAVVGDAEKEELGSVSEKAEVAHAAIAPDALHEGPDGLDAAADASDQDIAPGLAVGEGRMVFVGAALDAVLDAALTQQLAPRAG